MIFDKVSKITYGFLGCIMELMVLLILSSWLISNLFPNPSPNQYEKFGIVILLSAVSSWVLSLLIRWVLYRFTFTRDKWDLLFWWNLIRKVKHLWIKGIFLFIGFLFLSGLSGLIKSGLISINDIQLSQSINTLYDWLVLGMFLFFFTDWWHLRMAPLKWTKVITKERMTSGRRVLGIYLMHAANKLGPIIARYLKKEFQQSVLIRPLLYLLALMLFPYYIVIFLIMSWRRRTNYKKKQIEWERAVAKSGINEIDLMSGKEFEEKMWVHFKQLGWDATLTPVTNDYGADLVLKSPEGEQVVVQLKRYSYSVGVKAIQEVAGAINYYSANYGILITNSHVTKNARVLAKFSKVNIWEREELIRSLAQVHEKLNNYTG